MKKVTCLIDSVFNAELKDIKINPVRQVLRLLGTAEADFLPKVPKKEVPNGT